jgi:multiple sugar transport system substrate-binding protein
LGRYLPEQEKFFDENQTNELFLNGGAAIMIGGHWILTDEDIDPAVKANLGAAATPGLPFVGGMHTAIWKHSFRKDAAFKLIEFLSKNESALSLFPAFGLPARVDGLEKPPFSIQSTFKVSAEMAKKGRSFPSGHLWGLVENRLVDAIPMIWKEILESDDTDIEQILHSHLDPLAQRLNITVQS